VLGALAEAADVLGARGPKEGVVEGSLGACGLVSVIVRGEKLALEPHARLEAQLHQQGKERVVHVLDGRRRLAIDPDPLCV